MNINVNNHSSIQIDDIFVDPYEIQDASKKAKYVLITHTHYDHLSIEDIQKIIQNDTIFIATNDAYNTLFANFPSHRIVTVSPNQKMRFFDFELETFPSYNTNKNFHKKEFGWVGYKIIKDETSYCILGDTDIIPENSSLKCDVLFVPIGGTYTMTAIEASNLTNIIAPKLVVPVHYNLIVGSKEDENEFISNLNPEINYHIYL